MLYGKLFSTISLRKWSKKGVHRWDEANGGGFADISNPATAGWNKSNSTGTHGATTAAFPPTAPSCNGTPSSAKLQKAHTNPSHTTSTRQQLQSAGFTEVAEQIIRIPLNSWPKDKQEHDIGQWCLLGLDLYLEALTLGPFTRVLGWGKQRVEKLLVEVRRDLRTKRYHAYCELHVWTGRRAG